MKTLVRFIFLMVITCLLLSCNESVIYDETHEPVLKSANVPTPNIIGTLDLVLSPTSETNIWNGTIDFGDDYGIYDISFFTYPGPKDFSQVFQFDEEFVAYKTGSDWHDPANVVLRGVHKGQLVWANKVPEPVKWQSNGKITEANPPFEICMGRPQFCRGTLFGLDAVPYATGIMRIN